MGQASCSRMGLGDGGKVHDNMNTAEQGEFEAMLLDHYFPLSHTLYFETLNVMAVQHQCPPAYYLFDVQLSLNDVRSSSHAECGELL